MSLGVWIAGERDDAMAEQVSAGAAALRDATLEVQLAKERPVLELLNEEDGEQFIDGYQRALHVRAGVDWNQYRADVPLSRAQQLKARIRRMLLNVLRPPLQWLTFRQSAVNSQLTSLLMDERRQRLAMEARLQAQIDALRNDSSPHDAAHDAEEA
jgi:hypothetical protein